MRREHNVDRDLPEILQELRVAQTGGQLFFAFLFTVAFAPVLATASDTVSNTGRSKCFVPPLPGVTPPTILVPYAMACSE